MTNAKKKRKRRPDVLAGNAPDLQLYRGVRRYVKSLGGSVFGIGGIEIQEWPGDREFSYRVAVRVLGRRPTKRGTGPVRDTLSKEI